MKRSRQVGNLSSLHLPGIALGLKETTSGLRLSDEENKRLKQFFVAVKPLEQEAKGRMQSDVIEAKVRAIDVRVDRNWVVVRDLLDAYARLESELPLGQECAKLSRKYFSDMAFLRFDAAAQCAHGKTLLACLAEEPMSKELASIVRPALAVQKADHAEYEVAVHDTLVSLERVSVLNARRREANDALQAFVSLAEVMATTNEEVAMLNTILAPVDAMLAKTKASASRSSNERSPSPSDDTPIV